MKVMGIPIDNDIEYFKSALHNKGFKFERASVSVNKYHYGEVLSIEDGTFAGMPIDSIYIECTPISKTVNSIWLDVVAESENECKKFAERVMDVALKKNNKAINLHSGYFIEGATQKLMFDCGTIFVLDTCAPYSKHNNSEMWRIVIVYMDVSNTEKSREEHDLIKQQEDSDI